MEQIACKIWGLARDRLLISLRFLDVALSGMNLQARWGSDSICCDINVPGAAVVFYDPMVVIRLYKKDPNQVLRLYLHILLHCIFGHSYKYDRVDQELWDVAADMAVENVVLGLGMPDMETTGDKERKEVLAQWNNAQVRLQQTESTESLRRTGRCQRTFGAWTVVSKRYS